jgi:hypothetical protein
MEQTCWYVVGREEREGGKLAGVLEEIDASGVVLIHGRVRGKRGRERAERMKKEMWGCKW